MNASSLPIGGKLADSALSFLAGGGAATKLILERDWSTHPMGLPADWPEHFKTTLSLLLNSPESMILCWGPELHFFFNETYFPLLGPRLPTAMGTRFDVVWADGLEQAKPIIEAAMAGAPERFVDLPWKLGTDRGARDTWWTFSYSRVLNGDGSIAGLFIFTNETTQRVLSDAALAKSQQELRTLNEVLENRVAERTQELSRLWDSSPDLLAVVDLRGVFLRTNPAWADVLGYEPQDLFGRRYDELVHPEDGDIANAAMKTAAAGQLPSSEQRYRHRDGSYRWIAWRAAPQNDLVYAIGRDVTAEVDSRLALATTEAQLRQAQKVEALGKLTGGVAHDFNNLLTVIRGSVELLSRSGVSDERRSRYIQAIGETAERATRLTSQLLAFSRQQSLKPECFDVGTQLNSLVDMLKTLSGSRVQIDVVAPESPQYIYADRSQFDVAIVNLVVNARDAMSGEGKVTIETSVVDRMPARSSMNATAGPFIRVALRDTGLGMAPDLLEKVFEPFYTTKAIGHGTGLGLSQVYGFTKQSGGDVFIDSRVGEGTSILLYLPKAEIAVPSILTDASAKGQATFDRDGGVSPGSRGTVLIVEDNSEVAAFATDALNELGYRTVNAGNGIEALEYLSRTDERIDAVFSDVMMPGMTGLELRQIIRERYPNLQVILTSGFSAVLASAPEIGCVLLQKPYTLQQLKKALETVRGDVDDFRGEILS